MNRHDASTAAGPRSGRREGTSTTRAEILAAARRRFGQQGYAATTIRQVATDAGVDPALVHYFFKTKDGLFAAAVMQLPRYPAEVVAGALEPGIDGAGARLIRGLLEVWDDPTSRTGLLAVIRSATARPEAAQLLREFVTRELQPRIAAATARPDGNLRAVLIGSTVIGVAFERYVLGVEPLASADREEVVAWVGPVIQRYLSADPPAGREPVAPVRDLAS